METVKNLLELMFISAAGSLPYTSDIEQIAKRLLPIKHILVQHNRRNGVLPQSLLFLCCELASDG